MANTYTKLYVHIVFAVMGRQNQIAAGNRDQLEKFICGIISNRQSKPLAIYCNPDHTHILIGLHPSVKYILNQPSHHKRLSFKDEFTELLNKFEIEYDDKIHLRICGIIMVRVRSDGANGQDPCFCYKENAPMEHE